jgi:chromosome segregation ATPase
MVSPSRTRSPSPDRDGEGSIGSQESQKAHDTYPSFSEYAHVAAKSAIGELTFAVGLRSENPEEIVRRMLPLCVLKERPIVEKIKKPKQKQEIKICQRPECVARREKLTGLNSENDALRIQLKAIESKLAASQNKIALTEKTMLMNEEKIDNLKGQIEDSTSRIFAAEAEVEKLDEGNQGLRDVLKGLENEIASLKSKTSDTETETQQVVAQLTSGDRVVFASKRKTAPLSEFAAEVKSLSTRFSANQADDSD